MFKKFKDIDTGDHIFVLNGAGSLSINGVSDIDFVNNTMTSIGFWKSPCSSMTVRPSMLNVCLTQSSVSKNTIISTDLKQLLVYIIRHHRKIRMVRFCSTFRWNRHYEGICSILVKFSIPFV